MMQKRPQPLMVQRIQLPPRLLKRPQPLKQRSIGSVPLKSHPILRLTQWWKASKKPWQKKVSLKVRTVEYDVQNAQGDMPTASSIAQKFVSDDVDLIVSIATPTSQAAAKATTDIPIVFSAVTDPVAAGLVENPDAPAGNVTGVSDMLPLQPHLDLIQAL